MLLQDGRVLVSGGIGDEGYLSSVEVYDPSSHAWSQAATMKDPRMNHSSVLINDGKMLVLGGFASGRFLSSVELYDPLSDTWGTTGTMGEARAAQKHYQHAHMTSAPA